jgi:ribonuclease P protein component
VPSDQPAHPSSTDRLKSTKSFAEVYRRGRWVHGPLLSLGIGPNTVGEPRVGLRTKRGLKGAVVRNRLKRQLRVVVRRAQPRLLARGMDIVIVVHPKQMPVTLEDLTVEFDRLSRRARIIAA